MTSKTKDARLEQKTYWESKLGERISVLSGKGLEPKELGKDTVVRKIRAKIRETDTRLKRIAALEAKVEEMARTKAEAQALPKAPKEKKKKEAETQEVSKRQQKKQKKRETKTEASDSE